MNCIWTSCGELVNTITCCDIHFTCTEILLQVARNGNVRFYWLCLSQQLSVLLSGIKRTDKIHCCVPRFMSFESVGLVNTNSLAMALVHCISQYQSVSQSESITSLTDSVKYLPKIIQTNNTNNPCDVLNHFLKEPICSTTQWCMFSFTRISS